MNSEDQTPTKTQAQAKGHRDPLPPFSLPKGCGPSSTLKEETHHQNMEIEEENNNSCTINIPSVATNQFQDTHTNEPNNEIIQSQPTNKSTIIHLTTLEAKAMLGIGFTVLIGLLTVTYNINGNGNLVPTALFHKPTITFTLFLIIIMIVFYFSFIGVALKEAFPKITVVINIISFISIVLGATILLWGLIPNSISWIPWIFFACTAAVVFGVLVLGRFAD